MQRVAFILGSSRPQGNSRKLVALTLYFSARHFSAWQPSEGKVFHDPPGFHLMDELQHPFSEEIAGNVNRGKQRDEQYQRAESIYQEFEHECLRRELSPFPRQNPPRDHDHD